MRASSLQTGGGAVRRTPWPVLGAFLATSGCYQSYAPAVDPDVVTPRCGNGTRESGEQCDDGNRFPGDGCEPDCRYSCQDDRTCDDGLTCTSDRCVLVEAGRSCQNEIEAGWCRVDGTCRPDGIAAPGQPCLICRSEVFREGWSPVPAGTSCDDGLFCNGPEMCDAAGACRGGRAPCGAADCTTCDETRRTCDVAAAGTVCRPRIGSCDAEEVCDGRSAACPADGFLPAGAACDDDDPCTAPDRCNETGRCVGDPTAVVPAPPSLRRPENGTVTGSLLAEPVSASLRPRLGWHWDSDGCVEPQYEVQIDDSCPLDAFLECSFPSPEAAAAHLGSREWRPPADLPVQTVPPVGRRYFWRVRACRGSSCSDWTTPRYLEVGRVGSDFNGDGRSDLAAGAPNAFVDARTSGRVQVHHGIAAGCSPVPDRVLANPVRDTARFGNAIAAADFDADGFCDLAVGAPESSRVFVFGGGPAGIAPDAQVELEPEAMPGGGSFGSALAAGADFDSDGYPDLLVGAPSAVGPSGMEGAAFAYRGGVAGVEGSPAAWLTPAVGVSGGEFGYAVAWAGDVDGNGQPDAVVSSRRMVEGATFGGFHLFLGTAAGLSESPSSVIVAPAGSGAGSYFGIGLAALGDVNGDGFTDVGCGVLLAATDLGLFVYGGSAAGLPPTPSAVIVESPLDPHRSLGFAAAGGADLQADGLADVAVGAPDWGEGGGDGPGAVLLFSGHSSEFVGSRPVVEFVPTPSVRYQQFGHAVAWAPDLDGDGRWDLVVGDPFADGSHRNSGEVQVLLAGADGLPARPAIVLAPIDSGQDAAFGWSLAADGRIGGW